MAQGYSNGGGGMSSGNSSPGGQPSAGGNTNGNTNGGNLNIQPMPEPQPNPPLPDPQPQPAPRPPRGMRGVPTPTYIIYGTNEPYSGRVVEVGGQLYTTVGGALEGFSFQVMARGGQNDPLPDPRPRPRIPRPFDGSKFSGNTGFIGNGQSFDNSDKLVDDPMVDGTIIIDDPMGPDPFADQGNQGG